MLWTNIFLFDMIYVKCVTEKPYIVSGVFPIEYLISWLSFKIFYYKSIINALQREQPPYYFFFFLWQNLNFFFENSPNPKANILKLKRCEWAYVNMFQFVIKIFPLEENAFSTQIPLTKLIFFYFRKKFYIYKLFV